MVSTLTQIMVCNIHSLAFKEDNSSVMMFGHQPGPTVFAVFTPGTLFIDHRAEFDPERPAVSIVIVARDGGSPSLSSLTTVQVQISDVNDNAPVFHQSEYRSACRFLHSQVSTSESAVTHLTLLIPQSYCF